MISTPNKPADLNPNHHHAAFPPHRGRKGIALPAVLIIVVAMLILAVALLLLTGIERSTARSYVEFERAGLAVRAGFEEMQDVLIAGTMTDNFVVLGVNRDQPLRVGRLDTPYLFIARADEESGSGEIRYEPLFSHHRKPASSSRFAAPEVEPLTDGGDGGSIDFPTLPYQDNARASWVYLADDDGRKVARYAWFVEDMQGRLDASKAGNLDGAGGTHARAAYPFPAPGVPVGGDAADMPTLAAAALYAIDPEATTGEQGDLARTLMENRPLMVSPGSLLAAAGAPAPLARDADTGRLADPVLRAVEESLAADNRSYLERPEIPFAPGIDPSAFGTPKINLNEMLSKPPSDAVDDMADHIRNALPNFDGRKGGFPEDYLKTLAANALGYASDTPIVSPGEYRGIGAYPLVSEYLLRVHWADHTADGDHITERFRVSVYVELWNMTSRPVFGDVQISHETKYEFEFGVFPDATFADMTSATPVLEESDGYHWFPPVTVALEPNEYRVIKCGELVYEYQYTAFLDENGSPVLAGEPTLRENTDDPRAGYRMRWNGTIVDQSLRWLQRQSASMGRGDQDDSVMVRANISGHVYAANQRVNLGDPRMSPYVASSQSPNTYPENFSPNRRNVRRGTLYDDDEAVKSKISARVLPSEWPDGGHDSPYGGLDALTNHKLTPLEHAENAGPAPLLREGAPQRLSVDNRYYSATELGHVYDPIMWEPTYSSNADTDEIRSGRMPAGEDRWPDVIDASAPSKIYGGGNTLRIGRPEHPAFGSPGDRSRHAVRLLDLFHAGMPHSGTAHEREGPLVKIDGHVNLNTASRDVLRALAAGVVAQDPALSRRLGPVHETSIRCAPGVEPLELDPPRAEIQADRVADAIIAARPFASPGDAVFAKTGDGEYVFGNRAQYENGDSIQWSDAAAEELFARIHQNVSVRSRNFRVWIVGQSVAPTTGGSPGVLAEIRKSFVIFADAGERDASGGIIPGTPRIKIIHEIDF